MPSGRPKGSTSRWTIKYRRECARRIKAKRTEFKMDQRSLAFLAGVSPSMIGTIENENGPMHIPNVIDAQAIASALETTVDKLWPIQGSEDE